MSQSEFNQLLTSLNALSPEQLATLRRELDGKLATAAATQPAAAKHKPIWEEFEEIAASIPNEEWAKLPIDGAEQHDHYIYGTPKRPPSP